MQRALLCLLQSRLADALIDRQMESASCGVDQTFLARYLHVPLWVASVILHLDARPHHERIRIWLHNTIQLTKDLGVGIASTDPHQILCPDKLCLSSNPGTQKILWSIHFMINLHARVCMTLGKIGMLHV